MRFIFVTSVLLLSLLDWRLPDRTSSLVQALPPLGLFDYDTDSFNERFKRQEDANYTDYDEYGDYNATEDEYGDYNQTEGEEEYEEEYQVPSLIEGGEEDYADYGNNVTEVAEEATDDDLADEKAEADTALEEEEEAIEGEDLEDYELEDQIEPPPQEEVYEDGDGFVVEDELEEDSEGEADQDEEEENADEEVVEEAETEVETTDDYPENELMEEEGTDGEYEETEEEKMLEYGAEEAVNDEDLEEDSDSDQEVLAEEEEVNLEDDAEAGDVTEDSLAEEEAELNVEEYSDESTEEDEVDNGNEVEDYEEEEEEGLLLLDEENEDVEEEVPVLPDAERTVEYDIPTHEDAASNNDTDDFSDLYGDDGYDDYDNTTEEYDDSAVAFPGDYEVGEEDVPVEEVESEVDDEEANIEDSDSSVTFPTDDEVEDDGGDDSSSEEEETVEYEAELGPEYDDVVALEEYDEDGDGVIEEEESIDEQEETEVSEGETANELEDANTPEEEEVGADENVEEKEEDAIEEVVEEDEAAVLEIEAEMELEEEEGEEEVVVEETPEIPQEEEIPSEDEIMAEIEGEMEIEGEEVDEEAEAVIVDIESELEEGGDGGEDFEEEEEQEEERVPVVEETIVPKVAYELGSENEEFDQSVNETASESSNGPITTSDVEIDIFEDTVYESEVELDPRSCANTTFGCCDRNTESADETPAHGPNLEGCCLDSKFGCCPDNVRAVPAASDETADGAMDSDAGWCSCEDSKFGCCPDDVSPAGGPDFAGCGCQFSPHGCCPDQYTPAPPSGPSGCPCHTHEHGCCADGETPALGPNRAGCAGCEASEFGCCPDGFTPAEGAYGLGCGCAGSEFGCCPDGVSEAPDPEGEEAPEEIRGEPFAGCGEIPGEACHLDKDPGNCRENFTVRWFFDKAYGGCSRFWWSDCGGNANRFSGSEECEKMCVKPGGSGRCYLPKVKGPCNRKMVRWHFDQKYQKCMEFEYGGCLGNDNNFETQLECSAACVQAETEDLDVCSQPVESGPCRGEYPRFYYDQDDGECRQFNYTGCMGNRNRFSTLEECKNTCWHKAKLAKAKMICTMPKMVGICDAKEAVWYFDNQVKKCKPFYYTGCGGNENRFATQAECERTCPNAFPPEIEITNKLLVVTEEETATMEVFVEANPTPKISWLFKEEPMDISGGDERITQLPGGSLVITMTNLDDSGVYTVLADNGLGQVARNQMALKVYPSKMPIEVIVAKDQSEFEYGTAIVLKCRVRGYPIPAVKWYKNNLQLPRSSRISVDEDNTLTIDKATPIDGGVFTCRATNEFESISDSISIVVKEGEVPRLCVDKPELANCELIVRAQFCNLNDYYADFCCKSCTLAGQLGGQIQEEDEENQEDVLPDGVGEMEPK